jgi:hypothetical protein
MIVRLQELAVYEVSQEVRQAEPSELTTSYWLPLKGRALPNLARHRIAARLRFW